MAVENFTGSKANPPSPWWRNTQAVLIEGKSGVVVYGEIQTDLEVGDLVAAGMIVGDVKTVLTKDKGRPMSMLHLELHKPGTIETCEWTYEKPASLCDPTPHLLSISKISEDKSLF